MPPILRGKRFLEVSSHLRHHEDARVAKAWLHSPHALREGLHRLQELDSLAFGGSLSGLSQEAERRAARK